MNSTARVILHAMQDNTESRRVIKGDRNIRVWFSHSDIKRLTGLTHTHRSIRYNCEMLERAGMIELQRENWRNSSTICLYALTSKGERAI